MMVRSYRTMVLTSCYELAVHLTDGRLSKLHVDRLLFAFSYCPLPARFMRYIYIAQKLMNYLHNCSDMREVIYKIHLQASTHV